MSKNLFPLRVNTMQTAHQDACKGKPDAAIDSITLPSRIEFLRLCLKHLVIVPLHDDSVAGLWASARETERFPKRIVDHSFGARKPEADSRMTTGDLRDLIIERWRARRSIFLAKPQRAEGLDDSTCLQMLWRWDLLLQFSSARKSGSRQVGEAQTRLAK